MSDELCEHGLGDCERCDWEPPPNRIPGNSGDEYDAFTGWRKVISWGRGELARIKTGFNRRMRRGSR